MLPIHTYKISPKPVITAVHDDIDASIYEEVKDSN